MEKQHDVPTQAVQTATEMPDIISDAKRKFELACKDASTLQIVNNVGAAFTAVNVVALLREALSDEVMQRVFMPLMNTKVGFLTDRNGKPGKNGQIKPLYSIPIVRDAIIDGVSIGLLPTGNQFNIIAERMYPTKEGYTALLRKLGVKYFIEVSYDKGQTPGFAEIPCKINYTYNGEKNSFSIIATVKKDDYSSPDQVRGKAERRAKKALYEYITGCDFGDADEQSATVDVEYKDVTESVNREIAENANRETVSFDERAEAPAPAPAAVHEAQSAPAEKKPIGGQRKMGF